MGNYPNSKKWVSNIGFCANISRTVRINFTAIYIEDTSVFSIPSICYCVLDSTNAAVPQQMYYLVCLYSPPNVMISTTTWLVSKRCLENMHVLYYIKATANNSIDLCYSYNTHLYRSERRRDSLYSKQHRQGHQLRDWVITASHTHLQSLGFPNSKLKEIKKMAHGQFLILSLNNMSLRIYLRLVLFSETRFEKATHCQQREFFIHMIAPHTCIRDRIVKLRMKVGPLKL